MLAGDFQPNWTSAPGETIVDILSERNISITTFARSIECSLTFVRNLLVGKVEISSELAEKLHQFLGASTDFWLTREQQYRKDLARINENKIAEQQWTTNFPAKDMMKFGWISAKPKSKIQAGDFLTFFDTPNVETWNQQYGNLLCETRFRTSSAFESKAAAVATWIRQGEIQSKDINCKKWNPELFRKILSDVRVLTREKNPQFFLPKLIHVCAEAGVAICIVPTPQGCRASGATRFVSKDKAAMILSFRFLAEDHFWFTFFHEAGHLLLHSINNTYIDEISKVSTSVEEQEANSFASEEIIPLKYRDELMSLDCFNAKEILRFARKIGISAGLVVGQLRFFEKLNYNQMSDLIRKYDKNEIFG